MKVLIIGSGASGLASLKTALEHSHRRTLEVYGATKMAQAKKGSVMYSTVINTSKEMTVIFKDMRNISTCLNTFKFQHKVVNAERSKAFAETGKWVVKYSEAEGNLLTEVFDAIFSCTGHHSIPYMPSPFPGQSDFKGRIVHSRSYTNGLEFANQRVLVIGIGNSGGDIAVELSKISRKVYLATRSGSWIINRVWNYGEPSDLALLSRFNYFIKNVSPKWLQNKILEDKINRRFDHARFGLKPTHRFLEAHVTVNDELPNRIISGTIVVKPNVASFTENGVVFEDGTSIDDVDTVIFATGYSFAFPYLEDGKLIEVNENRVMLYKLMFLPELAPRNTLAVIGLIQPTGSIMPISEMQARLFCSVLCGRTTLPTPPEMMKKALKLNNKNNKHFKVSRRHTLQVNYVDYMEDLAKMTKVQPNVAKYFLTDPKLAIHLTFYGLVPYQYRLEGPHKWSEARKNIIEFDKRVFECTRTRLTAETSKAKPRNKLLGIVSLVR
ncbi:hypothetical protein M3Y97_00235200 [Aphelenchoides bicaudatus]|nr:hypothetical protein M3Y97_00235200 [Aphelenchoides bicaudatus]